MDKMETLQKLRSECERFLTTYTEESKASASKGAVHTIFNAFHLAALELHEGCAHPLHMTLSAKVYRDKLVVVVLDLRLVELILFEMTKDEVQKLGGIAIELGESMGVPFRHPRVSNLEELEHNGVTPYEIINSLNDGLQDSMLRELLHGTNMPPASA